MLKNSGANGLITWERDEIIKRNYYVTAFADEIHKLLLKYNRAFKIYQIESPILVDKISSDFEEGQFYRLSDFLLRPETTLGSYAYAIHVLNNEPPPIIVYQAGKSFRSEQDKTFANLRFKEFYQLEFQCIYSDKSKCNYYDKVIEGVLEIFNSILPVTCVLEESDRLPSYSLKTIDVIALSLNSNIKPEIEIASISLRKDFKEGFLVCEIAIGLDRLICL